MTAEAIYSSSAASVSRNGALMQQLWPAGTAL